MLVIIMLNTKDINAQSPLSKNGNQISSFNFITKDQVLLPNRKWCVTRNDVDMQSAKIFNVDICTCIQLQIFMSLVPKAWFFGVENLANVGTTIFITFISGF